MRKHIEEMLPHDGPEWGLDPVRVHHEVELPVAEDPSFAVQQRVEEFFVHGGPPDGVVVEVEGQGSMDLLDAGLDLEGDGN